MIEKTLALKTRALYEKAGDRDDHRAFNNALLNFRYMAFYPYSSMEDDDDEDDPCLLIGFSNKSITGCMDRAEALSTLHQKDDLVLYVSTALAYSLDWKRAVYSTSNIEPIHVPPVPWSTVLDAEVLGQAQMDILSGPVADFMAVGDVAYEFDTVLSNYLEDQTDIRIDVVYRDCLRHDINTTNLVYFKDELVGIIKSYGSDGMICEVSTFDVDKWNDFMRHIVFHSGIDKYVKKRTILILNKNKDPDEFVFVPGVTSPLRHEDC